MQVMWVCVVKMDLQYKIKQKCEDILYLIHGCAFCAMLRFKVVVHIQKHGHIR